MANSSQYAGTFTAELFSRHVYFYVIDMVSEAPVAGGTFDVWLTKNQAAPVQIVAAGVPTAPRTLVQPSAVNCPGLWGIRLDVTDINLDGMIVLNIRNHSVATVEDFFVTATVVGRRGGLQ